MNLNVLGPWLEFNNHVKTAVGFLEETYGYCQLYSRAFCVRFCNILCFGYEILVPKTEGFTLPLSM